MKISLTARVLVWLLILPFAVMVPRPAQAGDGLLRAADERDRVIEQLIDRLETLERQVQELKERESRRVLRDSDLDRITGGADEAPLAGPSGGSAASPAASGPESAPPAAPAAQSGGETPAKPSSADVQQQVEEAKAEAEKEKEPPRVPLANTERGGNLLAPGKFQIDTSFNYVHTANTRLIFTGFSIIPLVILGTLESEKVTQDAWTTNFGLRYGLMKDVQVGFRLPVTWMNQSTVRLSSEQVALTQDNAKQSGIGDFQFTATYQPLYEKALWPAVNTSLRVQAPTGRSQFDIFKTISQQGAFQSVEDFVSRLNTEGIPIGSGFWSLTPTVSFVKGVDPGILFGSVSYTYNLPRTVTLVQINGNVQPDGSVQLSPIALDTKLHPGSSLSLSLGLAVALNNQLSFNFSFSDSFVSETKQDGQKIPDSNLNVGQLNLGFTTALTRRFVVDFSGSIGLTPDAPSMAFSLGVPFTFDSIEDLWPFRRTARPR